MSNVEAKLLNKYAFVQIDCIPCFRYCSVLFFSFFSCSTPCPSCIFIAAITACDSLKRAVNDDVGKRPWSYLSIAHYPQLCILARECLESPKRSRLPYFRGRLIGVRVPTFSMAICTNMGGRLLARKLLLRQLTRKSAPGCN